MLQCDIMMTSDDIMVWRHAMTSCLYDVTPWHNNIMLQNVWWGMIISCCNVWNVCVRRSMGREYWQGGRRGRARQCSGVFICYASSMFIRSVHACISCRVGIMKSQCFYPTGPLCNNVVSSGCSSKSCGVDGVCITTLENTPICLCPLGRSGDNCLDSEYNSLAAFLKLSDHTLSVIRLREDSKLSHRYAVRLCKNRRPLHVILLLDHLSKIWRTTSWPSGQGCQQYVNILEWPLAKGRAEIQNGPFFFFFFFFII